MPRIKGVQTSLSLGSPGAAIGPLPLDQFYFETIVEISHRPMFASVPVSTL